MAYPLLLARLLVRLGVAPHLPGVRRRLDGGEDLLRHLSDRLLAAPLDDLERAAALLERPAADVIDLSQGAPRFDLVPSGGSKLPADRRGWPPPDGLPELRQAVAQNLLAENNLAVRPDGGVLVTAGVLGAAQAAFDAFVGRGDRVVLTDPCSPLYPLAAKSRGARVVWLTTWVEGGRLRFRLADLAKALRGARLLVLNSPANPTGGVIAAEDLEQAAWWADRYDVLILSDEAFGRFRYDDVPSPSPASFGSAERRTLTAGGVSQGYALAAARVGWLAGRRHLVGACRAAAALRAPFVPTLCQQIALAALRAPEDGFREALAGLDSRRRYAHERLRSGELNPAWPAGGYFLWVPVWELGYSGRRFAEELLRDQRVRVTPGDLFGPSGPGHVRVSFVAEDGRLHEGLNRLTAFVRKAQGERPEAALRAA